jgi:transcriptional regulator with XRE-family HTH domain
MGRSPRPRPQRLALKLLHVREALGISQAEMVKNLAQPKLHPAHISGYERGEREPSLPVLLHYARIAGVCLDVLVDDALELPSKLPARPKHTHR